MELAIILGAVIFVMLVLVLIYNGIVQRQHGVDRAWADVVATQRQFEQVVPNIEMLSQNYASYESGVIQSVVRLREALVELKNDASALATGAVMRQAQDLMQTLKLTVEAYPNLKADQVVQTLMNEIARIQDNVAAAVRIFNMNVAGHNAGLEVFPNNLVNALFNRQKPFAPFSDELASSKFAYSPYTRQ